MEVLVHLQHSTRLHIGDETNQMINRMERSDMKSHPVFHISRVTVLCKSGAHLVCSIGYSSSSSNSRPNLTASSINGTSELESVEILSTCSLGTTRMCVFAFGYRSRNAIKLSVYFQHIRLLHHYESKVSRTSRTIWNRSGWILQKIQLVLVFWRFPVDEEVASA